VPQAYVLDTLTMRLPGCVIQMQPLTIGKFTVSQADVPQAYVLDTLTMRPPG
jgi:hypothetical protein